MLRFSIKFLLFLLVSLSLTFAVYADEESKRDTEVLKRQLAGERTVSEAAKEAKKKEELSDLGEVTFEQIMADPDNIELNFAYAKTQVSQNDLLGAAGTLERILIIDPELHPVRLFYAVILFRLDNLVEAERELAALSGQAIPSSIKSEVKAFQKQIKLQKKKTRFSLRQSVGFGIEDNRNAAPSSKRRLVLDAPVNLAGSLSKQRDTNFVNVTSLDVVHDPGFAAGHEVFASATYFLQEQTKVDSLDISAIQYEVGARFKTPWFDFVPSYQGGHISLSRESFMRTQAGNFAFEKSINPKLDAYAVFKVERQDPLAISENLLAAERQGNEYTYRTGLNYVLHPTMRVGAEVLYANKNAEEEFNGYERMLFRLSHLWLWPRGQFVFNTVDGIFDFYDEPDTAVASRIRRDKAIRYNVTYGAPLSALGLSKILPKIMEDITLTVSYEYYRALSTITNNTYTNNRFQGLLTKKWEF